MNREAIFLTSLVIVIIVSITLITGASVLTRSTFGDAHIPAGTWITWAGIIALPVAILTGNKSLSSPKSRIEKSFSQILKALILTGVLWVPICYLLAGNMSFSFSEKPHFQGGQTAMKIFWYFNYAMVGLPLVVLLLHVIRSFFMKQQKTD